VREVALEATETARRILTLRDEHLRLVQGSLTSRYASALIEVILATPAMTAKGTAQALEVSYQTANKLLGDFQDLGLLREITGGSRNRVFLYHSYIDLLGGHFEP
jgi:Fic family protein